MVKFPSLTTLWDSTRSVIVRFPIQFVISAFAVVIWWLAIRSTTEHQTQIFYKLLALSNLAFCLTLSADLFSETKRLAAAKRWLINILIVIFCIVLFYVLSPQWYIRDIYRLALLIIAGHLLVSFAPYSRTKQRHAFWEYNKFLFLRFLTAVLYSGSLFLGLVIALASTGELFNITIESETYFSLFAFIAAGFNTLFFLAGIPADMSSFEQESSYPKGLKVFTQYVLIPLLTVYLFILIIYEFKILIDQKLPEGMVSILILGYAVFGFLSYLLTFPIRNQKGNEWMKVFSKGFFIMMTPLLVLLFIAVWVRIADYAITEPRYFLVLLSFWLFGITFYFLIAKSPNIQAIPITLCILAIFSTFGPQSASSIAERSQLARYKRMGNDADSEKEKAAVINYMVANYGLSSLQALTDVDLTTIQNQIKQQKASLEIPSEINKLEKPNHQAASSTEIPTYEIKNKLRDTAYAIFKVKHQLYNSSFEFINMELADKTINISGYSSMIDFQSFSKVDAFFDNEHHIGLEHINNGDEIKISVDEKDSVIVNLIPFFESLRKEVLNADYYSLKINGNHILIPDSLLTIDTNSENYQLKLIFKNLNISQSATNAEENNSNASFNGVLLIKERD